jgi:acetyl esterase/lipase
MRPPTLLLAPLVLAIAVTAPAQQAAQHTTLLLWPNGNPEPSKVVGPEIDPTKGPNRTVSGKPIIRITNVSQPNLVVYSPPAAQNNGAAALVFPGGSYTQLSYTQEGTDVCDWLNSIGMTCILVKYRVPEDGHYPQNTEDLEDAQQAMRLTRTHAAEWHIDPSKIGAIGFSAGAHLAVVLSTHPDFQSPNVPPSTIDARPNFQMVIYPGWLNGPASQGKDNKVDPPVQPTATTPPTLLVMAENDYTAHVENALIYYQALKDAKVPAELHLFTLGGHGFGLRPTELPISHWPALAETWLHTIHILGPPGPIGQP